MVDVGVDARLGERFAGLDAEARVVLAGEVAESLAGVLAVIDAGEVVASVEEAAGLRAAVMVLRAVSTP